MFCYFCMCYAGYDGIGETCWCWDATPESDSWVMESADWETVNSTVLELWFDQKSPPTWSSCITSRRCHVWLCDVASPIPCWHRLRRGGVTFRDSTLLNTANLCPAVFVVTSCLFTVMFGFGILVHFRYCIFEKWRKVKVRCIFSCIDSSMFWTGIFERPEEYIMVDHVVDRSLSLERAVTLCWYVR